MPARLTGWAILPTGSTREYMTVPRKGFEKLRPSDFDDQGFQRRLTSGNTLVNCDNALGMVFCLLSHDQTQYLLLSGVSTTESLGVNGVVQNKAGVLLSENRRWPGET